MKRLWPRSLLGQLLLVIAAALLLAQTLNALLLYRAQAERREAALVHAAAFRILSVSRADSPGYVPPRGGLRVSRAELIPSSPLRAGEERMSDAEHELAEMLAEMDRPANDVVVTRRDMGADAIGRKMWQRRIARLGSHAGNGGEVVVAAADMPGHGWIATRVAVPPGERMTVVTLIGQTLLIYAAIVGALAFALQRITRPLRALTHRLHSFATTRDPGGQLAPEGPDDIASLIVAHNAMEARIAALLDEKDVMLGAIGHDLKTPLAALRVRIESVDDEVERARMAATIEDITHTLDDILSLARVGRPSDPVEMTDLSALVAGVVEEFEDMGDPVTLADSPRLVAPLRATWLKRAVRNLVGNAVRYGQAARVSLVEEKGRAVVRIEDDGPGIAEADIARMMEPFSRGDPSRNSATGGAGLGLALARAIAEQHGGTLRLANRREASGAVVGLTAELAIPTSASSPPR